MRIKQKTKPRVLAILQMRKNGVAITEIAKSFDVSRQAIYDILKRHNDPLPKELAQKT